MHLAYPNVDAQILGHPFWGCVRYLSLAQAPVSPYRPATVQTPHQNDVLSVVEALVPEWLDRTSSARVHEIADAHYPLAGASLDFAYFLATIRCVRSLRLEALQDAGDVWCTGTIERRSHNEPALGTVTEVDFACKLQGFLNQTHDRLFFIPAPNMAEDLRSLCADYCVPVLSFRTFYARLDQACTTGSWPEPTVIAVGLTQLRELVGALFPCPAGEGRQHSSDSLASQWLSEIGDRGVFIGRERQLSDVEERLKSHRLVTVVGPGGMGKTRLAWEIINKNRGEAARDGAIAFVSLEAVTSSSEEAVLSALVSGLQIAPAGAGDLLSALVKRLCAFPQLLVLDNCETAQRSVRTIVGKLLEQCPHLTILATSQHQLGVHRKEAVYKLPPLSVPDDSHISLADLEHLESYQLFVFCARMADDSWTPEENSAPTFRRLLQLTEGIPLAIEIVAVWAPHLSLTQMCEELAEEPLGRIAAVDQFSSVVSERHRSMKHCLEWSFGHLSKSAPNDAAGFQQLGVFAGRFTADAVGKVCEVEDPLQLLIDLSKTSFVHWCPGTDPRRYMLRHFTRAFARAKAKEDGLHEELSQRHVSFYLSLLQPTEEEGVPVVDTPASWEHDWPDLLAAANAALNIGELQAVWRISRALSPFLHGRGLWSEREQLNRAAVDAASRASVGSALERARIDLGIILEAQGRWPEAVDQYELALVSANKRQTLRPTHQAMALQRLVGVLTRMGKTAAAERTRKKLEEVNHLLEQPRTKARLLDAVGKTLQDQEDWGNAEAKYREALQIRKSIGDTAGLARSKENLGVVLSLQGNWPLAEKELQECLAYWASQDDSRMRGILLHHLADLFRRQGRFPDALDHCTQSLQCREDDPKGQAVTLVLIAKIHRAQQHFDKAVAALEQSKNLSRSIGDVEGESMALSILGGIYSSQQKWPEALAVLEGSRRLKDSDSLRDVVGLGITLDRIAQLHARRNHWPQALAACIESLGYFKEAGRKIPAAMTLMNMAMMHAAQGQKAPALNTLDDAIESLESEDSGKAVLQEARKLRSRLDRKMRDGTPRVHWQDAAFENQRLFIRKQFDRAREAKRWQEAAASYEALAGEYTDSGQQMEAGLALNELGSVYRHLGDFPRSEETIRHALTIFEEIALPLGLAASWHKLGDLFATQRLWSKAEDAYNESIKLKRECFDDEGEAISQDPLCDVLVKLGRQEDAQRAANRSWEIMSESRSDPQKWHPLARLLWLKAAQHDAAGVQDIADRIATAFRGSRYRESTVRALQEAAACNDWENLQALLARADITSPTELPAPAPSVQGVTNLIPRISKLIQGCFSLSVASGAAFVRRVLAGAWRRH